MNPPSPSEVWRLPVVAREDMFPIPIVQGGKIILQSPRDMIIANSYRSHKTTIPYRVLNFRKLSKPTANIMAKKLPAYILHYFGKWFSKNTLLFFWTQQKYSSQKKRTFKLYNSLIAQYAVVPIIVCYLCLNSYHLTPNLEASSSIRPCESTFMKKLQRIQVAITFTA